MSQRLINAYLSEIDRLKKFAGTSTEQVIREAFKDLLKNWTKSNGLNFIPELLYATKLNTKVYPDGTILHDVRVPLGYWEAKDTDDDIDREIESKQRKGYPQDNIIYENSDIAVLIQNRQEVLRCSMIDTKALDQLLTLFFAYERQEIAEFRRAVVQFKYDLPSVLGALREKIDDAYNSNKTFQKAAQRFLDHAKETINPTLGRADVREMLLQHILTEEIFARVFDEADFHRHNNIARLLYELEGAFFTHEVKKSTLRALQPYYTAIHANAAQISSHTEKQTFLKVIYENFYKVYNPDAADRLGVVYTPNEIVRFMIEGADWLCDKNFGKRLIDEGVEILDPATGTGTYICELIEYFRGQPEKLRKKYLDELHANEVAILPYYVANLNIEATYQAVSGQFVEYPNLCFVDTLDNIGGLGIKSGHQFDLFGSISDENVERVKRQNKCKISVVIGNPPYNSQQKNENENNKNRTYPHIDGLIKRSFVKLSTAQKTTAYDMYARFFRWASDRLHDDGVIAFVTNRSFIDSRTFDGFRRYVAQEFDEIYLVDLGGDIRANPKLSGTKHNVFGIQTGVAISFFVRKKLGKKKQRDCKIHYMRRPEMETAEDKLSWLGALKPTDVRYVAVVPDQRANWIEHDENAWGDLLPIADNRSKHGASKSQARTIFRAFSTGIMSGRDEWVVDFDVKNLMSKVTFFSKEIEEIKKMSECKLAEYYDEPAIKLSETLKRKISGGLTVDVSRNRVSQQFFRPFCSRYFYADKSIVDRFSGHHCWSAEGLGSVAIAFLSVHSKNPLCCFASEKPFDYGLLKNGNGGTQTLPRHRYTADGTKIDNITDWALNKFTKHYGNAARITKDDIFVYVYAVLHDPIYRETYAINLKREFPRIPFYADFHKWRDWGQTLLDLHIGYESVDPWPLTCVEVEDTKAKSAGLNAKSKLKADKDSGTIELDSETTLSGIPPECWEYKLGNRSGLEWILDQYKEKKPRDPTVAEKFNTYRFADYKDHVIDLVMRVTRVSVETLKITTLMKAVDRKSEDTVT